MKQRIHIYGFLFIAMLCLGACVDEHIEEPSYIQFGVSVLEGPKTRGSIEAEGNFTGTMKLYGLYSGRTHIDGEPVSVNDGRATSIYTWPGSTALRFYAFANNTGLSVTPDNSALMCEMGIYTIASDASAQKDLLFGWVDSHSKADGAVSFEFQHALSRISFKAKQSGFPDDADVIITQVQIYNALNALSGKLTDAEAFNTISDADNEWDKSSGNRSTTFSMDVEEQNLTKTLAPLTTGTEGDYNMFLFPHTNEELGNASDSSKSVALKVTYTIGGVEQESELIDLSSLMEEDGSTPHFWGVGRWTVYEITIKPTGLLLEVDLQDWTDGGSEWEFLNRTLSVSQTEVNITDYNGARVYFSSNMPEVKVLEEVYEGATGTTNTAPTNEIFNDLANSTINEGKPYRFYYSYDKDNKKGTGYVEILVDDGINSVGTHTYRIVLAASDSKDSNRQLKREILVNVRQDGVRSTSHYIYGYSRHVGVFFRRNETGERIIMENNLSSTKEDNYWTAKVLNPESTGNWVIISSTPSLDPKIGTNDASHEQGRAEKYPVTINETFDWPKSFNDKLKEDGKNACGRGRIYFRVGVDKSKPIGNENRYAVIELVMHESRWWSTTNLIYVRQGEAADYVYDRSVDDAIPADGYMFASQTRDNAVRFSPYNLTAPEFKGLEPTDDGPNEVKLSPIDDIRGVAVKYPSQGGAYFQWFYPDPFYRAYAYSPNRKLMPDNFATDLIKHVDQDKYIGSYWEDFAAENEVCPEGFHRPSDGPIDMPTANALYNRIDPNGELPIGDYTTQIEQSEFRMSLMLKPDAGSGTSLTSGHNGPDPVDPSDYIYSSFPYRGGLGDVSLQKNSSTTNVYPALSNPPMPNERPGAINLYYTPDMESLEGFYADGFYDRYPKENGTPRWVVKDNSTDVAYAGILIYNSRNYKSLFIPYAGRRDLTGGPPDAFGSSAYLWLASSSPYFNAEYPFLGWRAVLQFRSESTSIGSVQYRFGQSIRCVADETTTGSDLIMPQ